MTTEKDLLSSINDSVSAMRDHVTEIKTDLKHVKERVDRINGNLEDHSREIEGIKLSAAQKESVCTAHASKLGSIEEAASAAARRAQKAGSRLIATVVAGFAFLSMLITFFMVWVK